MNLATGTDRCVPDEAHHEPQLFCQFPSGLASRPDAARAEYLLAGELVVEDYRGSEVVGLDEAKLKAQTTYNAAAEFF